MAVLSGLQPEKVFTYFEAICGIPHGSENTKQLSDWLAAFAKERGLECIQDELNNIVIFKEASASYENSAPVILQGHMDMVCNRADGCTKDMAAEGLDLAVDGDTIYAEGTTLGGDDGIAVAYMLALLDDDSLQHPAIEAIFTVDEETGLYGAEALDVAPLKGKRFINLDSEDEGILTVGCAGGVTAIGRIPVSREPHIGRKIAIEVSGFIGGHSGTDIIKGQENALKSMGRILFELEDRTDMRLIAVDGGVADNVIPTSAKAVVACDDPQSVKDICDECAAAFAHEYKVDPEFKMSVGEIESDLLPMDEVSMQRVIALLIGTPNGIEKMTFGIDNLPQTSLSLGVLRTEHAQVEEFVEYTWCIRSSVDSEREMLARRLQCQTEALGGSFTTEGAYPGWEYALESPLRDLVCAVYKEQTGKEMVIEAIHAGLECGFFSGKIPGLDCISIGPDLRDVHTPNETMSISSVQRTWDLLVEVLGRMK